MFVSRERMSSQHTLGSDEETGHTAVKGQLPGRIHICHESQGQVHVTTLGFIWKHKSVLYAGCKHQ